VTSADLDSPAGESSDGILEASRRNDTPRQRQTMPIWVIVLVLAALGVVGALGLGGALGGCIAVASAFLVPGCALDPQVADESGTAEGWVLRVALSAAVLALVFALSATALPIRSGSVLAALLLLSAALIVIRLSTTRAWPTRRAATNEEPWPQERWPNEALVAETPDATPAWFLVLDNGERVAAQGRTLLGRNAPATVGPPDNESDGVVVVQVSDHTKSVSRRHVLFDFTGESPVLIDQGSANGTQLTRTDGVTRWCEPGIAVPLSLNDIVSIGRHWLTLRAGDQ